MLIGFSTCTLCVFLQERIAKASSATKESEMLAKVKQDKVARIKNLRQQIATVQSETSKLKEVGREMLQDITWQSHRSFVKFRGESGVRTLQDVLGKDNSTRVERRAAECLARWWKLCKAVPSHFLCPLPAYHENSGGRRKSKGRRKGRKGSAAHSDCITDFDSESRWKKERLAPIMEQLAQEEEKLFEKIAQEDAEAAIALAPAG